MALFRKSRRQRAATDAPESQAAQTAQPISGDALRERLAEIAAASTVPEDALDQALRVVLEATRAQAGAVCVFDARYALLRLVTEVGLSDDGCRRLRSVRRGDPGAWDMPLQGLLNRRAYLIESASRNRYVPKLVEQGGVRTIACIPLYAGPTPVGSLILITVSPRTLAERDIRMLERGLGELAAIIEALRRRAGVDTEPIEAPQRPQPLVDLPAVLADRERLRAEVSARLAERAVLAAEVTARTGEAERLRAALDAANTERARLVSELERARRESDRADSVSESLATAEAERARLAAALEAAAIERAERARVELALEQARAGAERAARLAAAELEAARRAAVAAETSASGRTSELATDAQRLRSKLEQAEGALARERAASRERDAERERLAAELAAAEEREARLREDMRAVGERTDAAGDEAIRHAVETAHRAEAARAAAAAEVDAVRKQLVSAQEVVLALEEEAARANVEIGQLQTSHRVASGEYERLEICVAEGRAREMAATTRVNELIREMEALRQETTEYIARARASEAQVGTLEARITSLTAERDRIREALAVSESERTQAGADAENATVARAQLEESLDREGAERARLNAALATAQGALGELEATLARRESEMVEQAATIERLTRERDAAATTREAAAPAPIVPPAPSRPREPVRVVTVSAPSTSRPRARDVDPARLVSVLDVDGTWADARVDAHDVSVVAPTDDLAEQLVTTVPARIVVNLMAPGALNALVMLRAAGSKARFWGCIADAAADRVLALGMVEPATKPLDPDAIVEILGRYAARGTRVVTAGADVDGLMSLRQALARRGLSVSMAWDAKQAADLLQVVRPEVVVLDLGLPRRDGYGIVARLGTVDPVPSAVLLPGAEDGSIGFAPVLADPAHAGRMLTVQQFLAGVLAQSEEPPAERRQKVRAMGRK